MDLDAIRSHWQDWAARFGADLRATTKTDTIKQLELDAFARALRGAGRSRGTVLEVGCGNGMNCLSLARLFPELRFTGLDYVPEMVAGAEANLARDPGLAGRVAFRVGNALELAADPGLAPGYDVVFTDRMVINLNTWELQRQACSMLAAKVAPGGLLMMIENFSGVHARQNALRALAGLPPRPVAGYNRFLDEATYEAHLGGLLTPVLVEDFAALHDLVLYVLTPLVNGGEVDYKHPMVRAATELCLAGQGVLRQGEGGQNRLYVFRREP